MQTVLFWSNPTQGIHHEMNRYAISGRLKEVTKVEFEKPPLFKWIKDDKMAKKLTELASDGWRIFIGLASSSAYEQIHKPYKRFAIKNNNAIYLDHILDEDED